MLRRVSLLMLLAACAPEKPIVKTPTATVTAAPALPAAELVTLDGHPAQLRDALAGRPALISLWATWCEACAGEFASLARLSSRAQSLGAVVLAVAVGEPHAKVAEFVRAHQLGYAQLVDEQYHFADGLGQKRVPATLVLDRAGRIVYSGGVLDDAALSALERVLTARESAAR